MEAVGATKASDEEVRDGVVSVEWIGKTGLPGLEFVRRGGHGSCRRRRRRLKGKTAVLGIKKRQVGVSWPKARMPK